MTIAQLRRTVPRFFEPAMCKRDSKWNVLNRPSGTFLVISQASERRNMTVVYRYNPLITEFDYIGTGGAFDYTKEVIKNDFKADNNWIGSRLFIVRSVANQIVDATHDDCVRTLLTRLAVFMVSLPSTPAPIQVERLKAYADEIDAVEVKSDHLKDEIKPSLNWISTLLRL